MRFPTVGWYTAVVLSLVGVVGLALAIPLGRPTMAAVRFASDTPVQDMRFCSCVPSQEVVLERPDGLHIAGSLYQSGNSGDKGAVIMLHGNHPEGRLLALYRVLASRLAEEGYQVLAIDFAGFGQSGDPYTFGEPEALDRRLDVGTAVEFLRDLHPTASHPVYIVAHSMGATAALDTVVSGSDVQAVALIGPPRFTPEQARDPVETRQYWQRANQTHQVVYGYSFPQWYTEEMYAEQRARIPLISYTPYFQEPGHEPLLLIDGQQETAADHAYLDEFHRAVAPPGRYVTIARADQYLKVDSLPEPLAGVAIFDGAVVSDAVDQIDRWFRDFPR